MPERKVFSKKQAGPRADWGKIWTRRFIGIFALSLTFNLGQFMINNLLSRYYDSLGFSSPRIGLLTSAFAIAAFFARFVAGRAIDSLDRRVLLSCSALAAAAAYLGFAGSRSFPVLIALRLLQGTGTAVFNSCCLAVAADGLPRGRFTAGIGYFSCALTVAQAAGPGLGLRLGDQLQHRTACLIVAGLMLFAVVAPCFLRSTRKDKGEARGGGRGEIIAKEALLPALILFCVSSGFAAIKALLVVYAGRRGAGSEIGLYFTVYAVVSLAARTVSGKLFDRYGFLKTGLPAMAAAAAALAVISVADRLWLFLAAAALNALGYGTLQPALQALCIRSVPPERRGAAISTSYAGFDGATILIPVCAGVLADLAGYAAMWLCMALPILLGALLAVWKRERLRAIEAAF